MQNNNLNRILLALLLFVIAFAMFLHIPSLHKSKNNNEIAGHILVQRLLNDFNGQDRGSELFIMDGYGNNVQFVDYVYSPAVFSNGGELIAAECHDSFSNEKAICILDINTLPDYKNLVGEYYRSTPDTILELVLPKPCQKLSPNLDSFGGIVSLSWSSNDEKLALVCDGLNSLGDYVREVCIVEINKGSSCWDNLPIDDIIQVSWSPKEDVLVIGSPPHYSSKIFLVNPGGNRPVYITDGWAPEWSPNGDSIAFIRYEIMGKEVLPKQNGIATINKDGSGFNWQYLSSDQEDELDGQIIMEACINPSSVCYLTWSPDGNYIAFVGSSIVPANYNLLRLNLDDKRIIQLIQSNVIGQFIMYPNWGKH